jgi:hypothetical protein
MMKRERLKLCIWKCFPYIYIFRSIGRSTIVRLRFPVFILTRVEIRIQSYFNCSRTNMSKRTSRRMHCITKLCCWENSCSSIGRALYFIRSPRRPRKTNCVIVSCAFVWSVRLGMGWGLDPTSQEEEKKKFKSYKWLATKDTLKDNVNLYRVVVNNSSFVTIIIIIIE